MNLLDYIDSEDFREIVRENIIEYKIVGGVKTVPNEFITGMQNIDPFDIIKEISAEHKLTEIEKGSTAAALFNIHIKRVILEEIAKINMDVTNSVNQYISVVESFGFKKVYEKEYELSDNGYFSQKDEISLKKKFSEIYPRGKIVKTRQTDSGFEVEYTKKEKEFIYFNERNGMLFTGDTYNGTKINSAQLYFQGKIKSFEDFSKLQCSRSYINYTDYHDLNLDVREFLSKSIEEITKFVDLKSDWLEMSPYLYSYLSHDKGDSWTKITFNKIKEMPENIQEKLLGNNLIYSNPLLEEYSKEKGSPSGDAAPRLRQDPDLRRGAGRFLARHPDPAIRRDGALRHDRASAGLEALVCRAGSGPHHGGPVHPLRDDPRPNEPEARAGREG